MQPFDHSIAFLQANKWCACGVELLASQQVEKCSISMDLAEQRLQEIQQFLLSASEFSGANGTESRKAFEESTTPETRALVTQVSL